MNVLSTESQSLKKRPLGPSFEYINPQGKYKFRSKRHLCVKTPPTEVAGLMAYLMVVSGAKNKHRTAGRLTNNQLKRMWKKLSDYYKILSMIIFGQESFDLPFAFQKYKD